MMHELEAILEAMIEWIALAVDLVASIVMVWAFALGVLICNVSSERGIGAPECTSQITHVARP